MIDELRHPVPDQRRWWRRRRGLAIVVVGLLVAVVGAGTAGAAYVGSVRLPGEPTLPRATTLYYSDGATVLARLGRANRVVLPYSSLPDAAIRAAVAADDPDFWTDTGGPIAEAVLRQVYGVQGPASTRLRVLEWKLNEGMSKEEILALYLNGVSFGRGTFGIQAAANAYFGKSATREADQAHRLTLAETILLIALLRQPEPDPADPIGSPGYDPVVNAGAAQNSRRRWDEIRTAMVDQDLLAQRDADALAYPNTVRQYEPLPVVESDRPVGHVVNHVLSELTALPGLSGRRWADIANAGYEVTTTISPELQTLLENNADETVGDSVLYGQPANLQAAAVVIEPGTGRVLAYFGGHDGDGADYAGFFVDENGMATGFGAHPPGDAFTTEVLGAALRAGMSLRSRWNAASGQDLPGRTGPHAIRNISTCPTPGPSCTLLDSVISSLHTTAYAVTVSVTPAAVLKMAHDAGIDYIWDLNRARYALAGANPETLTPSRFDTVLGLGQYPVTVLDQANVMATFAAGGIRAQAHFVRTVRDGADHLYDERLPAADAPRVLSPTGVADLTYALSQVVAAAIPGVAAAGKTGTWEFAARVDQNAHAWMTGFTPALAMAVWIGNKQMEQPLKDRSGATIWGSGLPASIYKRFMSAAMIALKLPAQPAVFPPPVFAGNEHPAGSYG